MEANPKQKIVFFLTGRREGTGLEPVTKRLRPALLARYSDLTALRFDFPVLLNEKGGTADSVLSLSALVDRASEEMGSDRDRIAKHGYRIEHQIRKDLSDKGAGDFTVMWESAVKRATTQDDDLLRDSGDRLFKAFEASGRLVDVDSQLPVALIQHAWGAVQAEKAKAFREKADRLLFKLKEVLAAEIVGSAAGRTPEKLKAGVGASFADSFDFAALSKILVESTPGSSLTDERRRRIQRLIQVLESQKFYAREGEQGYPFSFTSSSEALQAYQQRHEDAVELVKALTIAELESKGDYHEATHSALFEGFGANGLDASELSQLPDYLVCTDSHRLDAAEMSHIVELLAANVPIKVVIQTDDVLEPSIVAEGHVALGLRARTLVDIAIGLSDVFVFQSAASQLYRKRESLLGGLSYPGPALFSVFSGSNDHTVGIPPYLVAAAAVESRVFPSLVYDPSAGEDWASRLNVDDNPQKDSDWPSHTFSYEDEKLQSLSETFSFTLADFMAMDDRFYRQFSVAPKSEWANGMISVPDALDRKWTGVPTEVPYIALVDDQGRLQRAVVDDRTLLEAKRCRTMWHSLQELGGIHNSHAERMLALERKARAEIPAAPMLVAEAAAPLAPAAPAAAPAAAVEAPAPETLAEECHGDDPYIETARCTTCNECTQLNAKMFAYNENKQAYIADPDAGTYRQLVEAAEGCQVSIIHPGKPRNPKEPGLEDLIKRAESFM